MTITEFFTGKGFIRSSRPSMNLVNNSILNEPSMTLTESMPVLHIAGNTENLTTTDQLYISRNLVSNNPTSAEIPIS
jgi:hypothetical protein